MNTCFHNLMIFLGITLIPMIPAKAEWNVGDPLPDLSVFDLEGELPDLKGKVVLVDFWASWCGPCKQSFPVLDQLSKTYGKEGLVILAVNQDTHAAKMTRFLKSNPVGFSIVRDIKHEMAQAAGVKAMPSSYLVDAAGTIRFFHKGFHAKTDGEQYAKEIEQLLNERQEASE